MDFTAFLAGASLTAGRIVVLDLNGNIKILAPGQAIAPGELVIETLEETDVPQFRIATDAGETNITDDIQQIFAALEEGQDPTQLGDDFATAAGETGGSSLVAGGTISRTGAESLASTDFSTQGLQALGLSETQSLALANQLRAFNDQITIVEPTPDERPAVSSISNPTVSEGDNATFDVSLSNASTTATTVALTLAGDSATAGTDFTSTEVTITYQDGTTQTVAVNGDGTFDVAIPAGDTTFSISVQTTDDNIFEGDETFTLSGQTATQASAIMGTATITDNDTVPVLNADFGTVNEDDVLIVTAENGLLSNDSDVDGDTLSVTGILSGSTGTATAVNANGDTVLSNSYGILTIRADGSYSFNANGEDAQKLASGQTAPVVFTYTASDGTESLTNTLTITISGINDAPETADKTASGEEDAVSIAIPTL
ncbi:VCBS domain-containing protein, partial [Vibrio vulnificus]|uniref:VCBS domain-containing protein n=2 Tax=Vibrio vulnificus TaxID=672 RepID=UPI001CDD1872